MSSSKIVFGIYREKVGKGWVYYLFEREKRLNRIRHMQAVCESRDYWEMHKAGVRISKTFQAPFIVED